MKLLIDTMDETLIKMREACPKRRFAISNDKTSIWVLAPNGKYWQCMATTMVNYAALTRLPEVAEGTENLPKCRVVFERGEDVLAVNSEGEWNWERVYGIDCTIFEPLEK